MHLSHCLRLAATGRTNWKADWRVAVDRAYHGGCPGTDFLRRPGGRFRGSKCHSWLKPKRKLVLL